MKSTLDSSCISIGMIINTQKSVIIFNEISALVRSLARNNFSYSVNPLEKGLKYLGFSLKPNKYLQAEWVRWLRR